MKRIAIYIEGGGDSSTQKSMLRSGFDELFKAEKRAAQNKNLSLRLVPSGSRNDAYKNFTNEIQHCGSDTLCVFLVDSEGALEDETAGNPDFNAEVRKKHLIDQDQWDLKDVKPQQIHLMVQCMETWLVADPDGLASFYEKNFHPKKLPTRPNLEDEPKSSVYQKLAKATKDTTKGEYSDANNTKIKHASKLLALIATDKLAARCPRFATFIKWLNEQIDAA